MVTKLSCTVYQNTLDINHIKTYLYGALSNSINCHNYRKMTLVDSVIRNYGCKDHFLYIYNLCLKNGACIYLLLAFAADGNELRDIFLIRVAVSRFSLEDDFGDPILWFSLEQDLLYPLMSKSTQHSSPVTMLVMYLQMNKRGVWVDESLPSKLIDPQLGCIYPTQLYLCVPPAPMSTSVYPCSAHSLLNPGIALTRSSSLHIITWSNNHSWCSQPRYTSILTLKLLVVLQTWLLLKFCAVPLML